ncbi:MAG: rhomboid family intramembrane serine protease [Gammaproteobacteria bacterium]|nr:rhomboid family intramembrane serine protease [Gammaproteobacteria bacterium]
MNPQLFSATNIIVFITCIISIALMTNHRGKSALIFHPVTIARKQQWHRFLTAGFIHGDGIHLAINMFVLWSFGNAVETRLYPDAFDGAITAKYLGLYLGGIVVASVPAYFRHRSDPQYMALGASGGVSAVVFAAILFAPWSNLYLYGVIAIPQILAGVAYLYYSWYSDRNANDNIGHMAHFAGAVWGFFYTGFLNPDLFGRFVQMTMQGPDWFF